MTSPYSFHLHLAAWLGIAALGVLYLGAVRRAARTERPGTAPTRRQWFFLAAGLLALVVALTWPVADLAAHWSLTMLLGQRMILVLVAAPLLLLATPAPVLARLTGPILLDDALDVLTRPKVAVAVFATLTWGTLSVPAVEAQASSWIVRAGTDLIMLAAGTVLWGPVLRHIPGAYRAAPIGVAAYLFVQSVLPGLPSVLYVFAGHPFYPVFDHVHRALGLQPLSDQRLAGVLAKVATLPVLWTVAWATLTRARESEVGEDGSILLWVDVERRLQRAERRERFTTRHPALRRPPRPARPIRPTFPTVHPAAEDRVGEVEDDDPDGSGGGAD